jgi:repressor LexA
LKRVFYYQEQALLILRAENPIYEEMRFAGEELNQVHILGKAVAFQSDVR